MAQTATTTLKSIKTDVAYNWVGVDKKGNRVKGKDLAVDEQALRNDLRRRGIIKDPATAVEPAAPATTESR